ncbi:hypothetical protein [Streptomyces liangshanensis]|uniref:Uncharacterized protein n=1 Tax=Streptomyces liangshanensis TaxID=2717324 RepID=A0A6G9GUZ4_9ACTN|nr:hypothetical protein [Streptomyces liangshanensis]QIQ02045.1 hypothetical protein HA039_06790 [Streptomyces liangshanensis]
MSTDIHGGIEFRHPGVDAGYYDGEPWVMAMDLWPLYDQSDYAAFGYLFGVRNYAGFRPLAADRGLPPDLSDGLRAELELMVEAGELHGATWVSWAELSRLDLTSAPAGYAGRLTWSRESLPSLLHQRLVPAQWPREVLEAVGPPPLGLDRSAHLTEWVTGDLRCRYEPLTAGFLLGSTTQWPHVFAVMKALAGRFGEEEIRLVVAFD